MQVKLLKFKIYITKFTNSRCILARGCLEIRNIKLMRVPSNTVCYINTSNELR